MTCAGINTPRLVQNRVITSYRYIIRDVGVVVSISTGASQMVWPVADLAHIVMIRRFWHRKKRWIDIVAILTRRVVIVVVL